MTRATADTARTCLLGCAALRRGDRGPADETPAPFSTQSGVDWSQLSAEQQELLKPYRERWDSLPPGRQQAMAPRCRALG